MCNMYLVLSPLDPHRACALESGAGCRSRTDHGLYRQSTRIQQYRTRGAKAAVTLVRYLPNIPRRRTSFYCWIPISSDDFLSVSCCEHIQNIRYLFLYVTYLRNHFFGGVFRSLNSDVGMNACGLTGSFKFATTYHLGYYFCFVEFNTVSKCWYLHSSSGH